MFNSTRILKILPTLLLASISHLSWAEATDSDAELGPLPQLDTDVSFKGACRSAICQGQFKEDIRFDDILKKPVAGGRISSHYGHRVHPIAQTQRMHSGIDYAVPKGSKVKAAQHGKVVFAGYQGGYGNLLVIKHNATYKTVYAHLDKFNVSVGDWVNQGEVVAYSGSTGLATGPHLHFEIRKNSLALNPLTGKSASEQTLVLNNTASTQIKNGRVNRQSNGRVRTILK